MIQFSIDYKFVIAPLILNDFIATSIWKIILVGYNEKKKRLPTMSHDFFCANKTISSSWTMYLWEIPQQFSQNK